MASLLARRRHRDQTLDAIQRHDRLGGRGLTFGEARAQPQVVAQTLGIDGLGCQALEDVLDGAVEKVGLVGEHRPTCQENVFDEAGIGHDLLGIIKLHIYKISIQKIK